MRYSTAVMAARQRACLLQIELAARSGFNQGALSSIESGRRRPTLEAIERLAGGLGVPALVIHLLATYAEDLPRGRPGLVLMEKITSLVDALWPHSRGAKS